MHCESMQAAGAARHGILKLHEVVKHVCRVVNARETIKSWGTVIRNQYNVDNLALTIEVHLHPDLKPVLDIVTSQGAQIVNLYRQQTINEKKSDAQHQQIIALLTTLHATYGQALPLPENVTANASAPSTPVGVSSDRRAEKRPAHDGAPGHGPKRLATYTSTPTSLPASSATPPTVCRISGRVVGDALLQAGADDAVASTLKDVSAKSLYDRMLRNNGQVPTTIKDKREKRRAHLVLYFYESICTANERKDLRSALWMRAGARSCCNTLIMWYWHAWPWLNSATAPRTRKNLLRDSSSNSKTKVT
mmetsp:Transcript_84617/g.123819  ORF Transcript_84617/g.123819 Transcript_84617/m.123819 type:complete len:306 (-) Transcript_84617:714-1631(-)